jgi:probable F420-dependent oxidoreductase
VQGAPEAQDDDDEETCVTRLGVAVPFFHSFPVPEYLSLLREVEARGYDTAWAGEVSGPDAIALMTVIASHTSRIRLAGGVIPFQTRSPLIHAQAGITLAHLAPGRVALGLGVSSRTIVGQWHGLPFDRPLAQLREAITIIRAVMSGERVTFEGEFYRVRGFRLTAPLPPKPVEIYLGALGPRMLELAGEVADGVLLNWLPPEAVPGCLRHLEIGARRIGRTPADVEVAAFIRTAVTDEPAPIKRALARDITGYAIVDSYAAFFRSAGYGDDVAAVNAAWTAGDRSGAVTRISDRFVDGLGAVGTADFCRDRIAQYVNAGVRQPVVVPFTADADPRPSILRTIRSFP